MALVGGVQNLNEGVVRSIAYQVSISGAGTLAQLGEAMKGVRNETARVQTAMASTTGKEREHQDQLARLAAEYRHLEAMVKLATAGIANGGVVNDKLVQQLKKTEGQSQRTSYALFQVAYAIDDIQYGLPALTNNIVGIATGMAQMANASQDTMKYITGLSVVVVAAAVVYNNWDKILAKTNELLGVDSPIKTAREEMEALKKETHLSGDKQARLNQLTEQFGTIAAIAKIKSEGEEEQDDAFQKAMKEAGGGQKFEDALMETLLGENVGRSKATEDKIAYQKEEVQKAGEDLREEMNAPGSNVFLQNRMRKIYEAKLGELNAMEKAYSAHREDVAKGSMGLILADAKKNEAGIQALLEKVRANEKNFAPGTLDALQKATEGGRQQTKQDKIDQELAEQRRKEADKYLADQDQARLDAMKKAAESLKGGFISERSMGKTLTQKDIVAGLSANGVQGGEQIAQAVLAILEKEFDEAVGKHQSKMAAEGGVLSVPREVAIADMRNEAVEKNLRQEKAEQAKILREQNALDRAENAKIRQSVQGAAPGLRKFATGMLDKHADPVAVREAIKTALAKEVGVPSSLLDEATDLVMNGAEHLVGGLMALRGLGVRANAPGGIAPAAPIVGGGGGGQAIDMGGGAGGDPMRMVMGALGGAGGAIMAAEAMTDDTDPGQPFKEKRGESRKDRLARLLIWKRRRRELKARAKTAGADMPGGGAVSSTLDLDAGATVNPNIAPGEAEGAPMMRMFGEGAGTEGDISGSARIAPLGDIPGFGAGYEGLFAKQQRDRGEINQAAVDDETKSAILATAEGIKKMADQGVRAEVKV